jgi:hypothetical protein
MGTLFAAYPAESPGDIMSLLNMVRLPLIFESGLLSRSNRYRRSVIIWYPVLRSRMATI